MSFSDSLVGKGVKSAGAQERRGKCSRPWLTALLILANILEVTQESLKIECWFGKRTLLERGVSYGSFSKNECMLAPERDL